jgi:DNA-binding LacI/PurR family transcriptional regulator
MAEAAIGNWRLTSYATGCIIIGNMARPSSKKKPSCTIADIARLAGVSKSTVSRALNDSPLIGEETKERIRAIAKERHFQINVPARRLTLKQSNTVAFVTHAMEESVSFADLFSIEILGGITAVLKEKGYDLLFVFVDPCDRKWPEEHLAAGRADGFILMTSTRKTAHIQMLAEIGAPFIAWGVPHETLQYCTVCSDNLAGGRLATEHLIGIGRQRIAFLGGPAEEKEVHLRFEGYAEALRAVGREPEDRLIVYGDFTGPSGGEKMKELLERTPDLDAVFINSDLMALSTMKVLREAGRRIPDDVALVGFDNLTLSETTVPPLTTVSQNIPLAGRMLAENLLQYIQNRVVTHTTVPVELIIRESA